MAKTLKPESNQKNIKDMMNKFNTKIIGEKEKEEGKLKSKETMNKKNKTSWG